MTLRERRRQMAVLRYYLGAARERLTAALRVPDYEVALLYQTAIIELTKELHALDRATSKGHELYLVRQQDPYLRNFVRARVRATAKEKPRHQRG